MLRETELNAAILLPALRPGMAGRPERDRSMPGIHQFSIDQLKAEAQEIARLNIPAVILFASQLKKTHRGSENFAPGGIIQQAIRSYQRCCSRIARHHRCMDV